MLYHFNANNIRVCLNVCASVRWLSLRLKKICLTILKITFFTCIFWWLSFTYDSVPMRCKFLTRYRNAILSLFFHFFSALLFRCTWIYIYIFWCVRWRVWMQPFTHFTGSLGIGSKWVLNWSTESVCYWCSTIDVLRVFFFFGIVLWYQFWFSHISFRSE